MKIQVIVDANGAFVTISEVAAVRRDENEVTFVLKSGKEIVLIDDEDTDLQSQIEMFFEV